jgi:Spy/CpxP family protein refolding chaperone
MNYFKQNRVIFWVLMILVLINVSALVSFFIFTKTPARSVGSCYPPEQQQCNAFRDELKLSDAQTIQVNTVNKQYKETAGPIADSIKVTRAALLTELEKVVSDTAQLTVMSQQLALLQVSIQKENVKQYLALKQVCTPEQAQRLSALYRDLYGCPMQNGQMKNRYRHGQGASNKAVCE